MSSTTTDRFANYRKDRFLMVCGGLALLLYLIALTGAVDPGSRLGTAADTVLEMVHTMGWGMVLAILVIGVLDDVPGEFVVAIMGPPNARGGVVRAAIAGVLLDLCSHGILMVGSKLYGRGISSAQLVAFLIASPWNSLSMTLILIAMIGIGWTLIFILLSLVIAVLTGLVFQALTRAGQLPENPNAIELPEDFRVVAEARRGLSGFRPSLHWCREVLLNGIRGARIVIRWLVFGLLAAAALRAFLEPEVFATWFGPTLLGLGATLVGATIFEVCSEGAVPIAADLVNRAGAPGNAFTFLLAGVATDYTEVMVIRETTGSWRLALLLGVVTVPQVLVLGVLLNQI